MYILVPSPAAVCSAFSFSSPNNSFSVMEGNEISFQVCLDSSRSAGKNITSYQFIRQQAIR